MQQTEKPKMRKETYGEAIGRSHKAGARGLFRRSIAVGVMAGVWVFSVVSLLQEDDATVPHVEATQVSKEYKEKIEALRELRQNKAEEIYRLQKKSGSINQAAVAYSDREQDIAALLKVENAQDKILVQLFNDARLPEQTSAVLLRETVKAGDLDKKEGLGVIALNAGLDITELRECQTENPAAAYTYLIQPDVARAEAVSACIRGSSDLNLSQTVSGALLGSLALYFGAPALRRRKYISVETATPEVVPTPVKPKRLRY